MNAMTMRAVRAAGGEVRHVPAPFVPAAAPQRGRKKRVVPDPIRTNGEGSAEQLRLLIERLENLMVERSGINDDIADVFAEAKGTGFDKKGMMAILAFRKQEKHARDELEAIVETYKSALGLV